MGECLITRRGGEAYELPVLNSAYPANVTVVVEANASASFNVQIATPGKPAEYTYQWYLNGAKISGATNAGYTKTGLTAAGTHTLYCVVTNKAGTVTSRVATLTVKSAKPTYTYTGSHQLIDDGNYNWRIKLKTSGTLRFTDLGNMPNGIQVFYVGGGGGGGYASSGGGGGGGGYTKILSSISVSINTNYSIVVGAGGAAGGNSGGTTSAFSASVSGGAGGSVSNYNGGNGGSGGGGGSGYGGTGGAGGSNGSNGNAGGIGGGGTGQGTTTREFGETGGALYAGGGGASGRDAVGAAGGTGGGGKGYSNNATPVGGTANTGGGGGGGHNAANQCGAGGSGIVIIRNAR